MSMGKKKDRFYNGVKLADNLYPGHKDGYWRYRRPDRTFKRFQATVGEANLFAEDANERRGSYRIDRTTMLYAVERYIAYHLGQYPSDRNKESWKNRAYAMRAFAREFPNRAVTERQIWSWWDTLTHSQQVLRQAAFRRMWTWLLREGYVATATNPFEQVARREKPPTKRERLTFDDYWKIYDKSLELEEATGIDYTGLRLAMGISAYTTLRREDVVTLEKTKHLEGGYLRRLVSKSDALKGELKAARLQWKLSEHPVLAQMIEMGIEHGAKVGCPYIVCQRPQQRRWSKTKKHSWQMLPDRITTLFGQVRDAAGVGGENPPTFHEVRSLGSAIYGQQGEELTDVMAIMGHSDVEMTKLYQSGHELPYTTISLMPERWCREMAARIHE